MSFEEELRKAMARREPSEDFASRVLERARKQDERRGAWPALFETARGWRLVAAMSAFLALTGGALYRDHKRIVRGEAAKQELLTAMRITGSKLRLAQEQVVEVEKHVGQNRESEVEQ